MAQKRMVSKQIIDSDAFLDMSPTAQLLYFHLVMRADDEGFVGNPKKIMREVGIQGDDYKILVAKRFLIVFESGVVVIKHWLIHNTIRMDRFNETTYQDEKNLLSVKTNKAYTEMATIGKPSADNLVTQVKLSKVNLIKDKLSEDGGKPPTPAQEARDFFEGINVDELLEEFNKKTTIPQELLAREVIKFATYWTEKNKSGTKQRWELESTFEVKRRLATWFAKIREFNNKKETKIL